MPHVTTTTRILISSALRYSFMLQPTPSRTLKPKRHRNLPNARCYQQSPSNCTQQRPIFPTRDSKRFQKMKHADTAFVTALPFSAHNTRFIRPLSSSSPLAHRQFSTRQRHVAPLKMQTWSDPAVAKEYIDFLSGVNQRELKVDCPSTILGYGRIGHFLQTLGKGDDLIIRRGESIPPDAPGPVYVCTRNDQLEDIILNCPEEKREDLVFIQNGYLENLLRKYALNDNTKANLYFAVNKFGAKPIDGITETNPEGLTAVCGKWEGAFRDRMEAAKLTCKVVKDRDFRRGSLEKLIWISVFNLIGAVHGNITMGEVAKMHVKEVTEMSIELAQMVRFTLTVGMLPNIEDRLLAYGRAVKEFPTALKEFKWRNGFFYDYSNLAKKNNFPDPTPMHTEYLEDGKKMGLIEW